jgi:hypothetical protein
VPASYAVVTQMSLWQISGGEKQAMIDEREARWQS